MTSHQGPRTNWVEYYIGRDIFEEHARKANRHRTFFETISKVAGTGEILDVGVGFGTCAVTLHLDYGFHPLGVDINKQMLDMATSNFCKIAPSLITGLVMASGLSLPFQSSSIDVTYSQGLLEHFSDRMIKAFIVEGLRVARYFAFSVPTCYFRTAGHFTGDERLLTKEQWEALLVGYPLVFSSYYFNREEYFAVLTM